MRKTTEMTALFSELRQSKHATPDNVREQIRPIMQAAALIRRQVAEDRALLTEATMSADDFDVASSTMERVKQTCDAIDDDLKKLDEIARRLLVSMTQRARYADEIEASVDKLDRDAVEAEARARGPN